MKKKDWIIASLIVLCSFCVVFAIKTISFIAPQPKNDYFEWYDNTDNSVCRKDNIFRSNVKKKDIEELRVRLGMIATLDEIIAKYEYVDGLWGDGDTLIQIFPNEEYRQMMSKGCFYCWEDVLGSMMTRQAYYTLDLCDSCWHPTIKLHFSSPRWTWVSMCGREGKMIICPHCLKQLRFCLTGLN